MPDLAKLFDAHTARDPTQTIKLRKAFRATAKMRLRQLRAQMRKAVNDYNILNLGRAPSFHPPQVRLQAFQGWMNGVGGQILLGTDWARPYIERAWKTGEAKAIRETGRGAGPDRSEMIAALARVEIEGILGATVQQATRAAASVIARGVPKPRAYRQLFAVFDKIAQPRLVVMCDVLAIKAYNEAKLSSYAASGIKRVGIHAERLPGGSVHTHMDAADAERPPIHELESTGHLLIGAIEEFEKLEAEAEEEQLVGILTAGDDKVCQLCEDWAEDSPYEIEEVRDVYPLHPRCRCAVYPWEDLRFKGEDAYDPSEPRDPEGKWTTGGGGGGGSAGKGYSAAAHVDKHGVIHTSNIYDAQRALYEGRKVSLNQPRQLSTLIHKLGQTAAKMKALGRKAPVFNLCNVTVKGTNLFCAESRGIPRVQMPQLTDEQTAQFRQELSKRYGVEDTTELASHLRATQDELNGAKVASAANLIETNESYAQRRIIVSSDNYVLDGHHFWAGKLALDSADGTLDNDTKINITRIDVGITELLDEADKFTGGKGRKGVGEDAWFDKYNPEQPRDPAGVSTGGRWIAVGGGGGHEFFSPNVEVNSGDPATAVARAAQSIRSSRQRALSRASKEIDDGLHLSGARHDAVGAWADGAESTVVTSHDGNPEWDKLRVSAAMKGYLADQKQVLIFKQEDGGTSALYRMHVEEEDLTKLHQDLIQVGLVYHTIVPHSEGGADVLVVDQGGKAHDAMDKAAERYNGHVTYEMGKSEFLGTEKEDGTDREQRDDARRIYREIIEQSPVQSSKEIWKSVHHSWGETLHEPGRGLTSNVIAEQAPQVKGNSRAVPDVAQSLHTRAQSILERETGVKSITRENATPALEEYVARTLSFELKDGLINGHSAETWYSDKMKRTIEIAALIHPEIATDKGKRFALTVALSVASQGEKVERAARIAEEVYTRFNAEGKFPTDIKVADPSITGNFVKMNKLVERFGLEGTEKLFNTEFTNRELFEATGYKVGKTTMDDKVYGSAVLGPKIGQGFYQNLNGNFEPITMDMWFMRSWGRLTGTGIGYTDMEEQREIFRSALKNEGVSRPPQEMETLHELAIKMVKNHEKDYKETRRKKTPAEHAAERFDYNFGGSMVEAPKGGKDRIWITKVFDKALDILDREHGIRLTRAAAQATWWTPEQILYKRLGARVVQTSSDYAAAFEKIAREKGIALDSMKLEHAPWIDDPDPYDEMSDEDLDHMVEGFAFLMHKHKSDTRDYNFDPNEPRNPKGEWTIGGGGGEQLELSLGVVSKAEKEAAETASSGKTDIEKFHALKTKWADVNIELLKHIDRPDGPESQAHIRRLEAISKEIQKLHADPGTPEGIGLPGGPRDVVVVGAGPGGLSAGINGAAEGLDTMIIEANTVAGGQAKFSSRIENFGGWPIGVTGEKLTQQMFTQAQRLGAATQLGTRVVAMTYDETTGMKHLTLSDGQKIDSRAVILAGGVEFRKLNFPGSEGPGVYTPNDTKKMIKEGEGGTVVVVGGSNGAAQAALGCAETAEHVYIMARSPIKESMSDYQIAAVRNHPKITVIEGDSIKQLNRDDEGQPDVIETTNGNKLKVDVIGGFIGSVPVTKWVPEKVQKDKTGRLHTNKDMQTDIPGVYAVGDMREGAIGRVGVAYGEGQWALREAFMYLESTKKKKTGDSLLFRDARKSDPPIAAVFQLDIDNPWFGQTVEAAAEEDQL